MRKKYHSLLPFAVKPSPVTNLAKVLQKSNSTCLCLQWDHSNTEHDKLAIVIYTSQWNPSLNMVCKKLVFFFFVCLFKIAKLPVSRMPLAHHFMFPF
jgi:hypothetical protein